MTIIEIRPFRNGWKCFEAPGVEPVFPGKGQAIAYAQNRACFRSGEVRIFDFKRKRLGHHSVRRRESKAVNFSAIIKAGIGVSGKGLH